MQSFLARHTAQVKGTLSGFDRVRFRGTLRWLANTKGMGTWLRRADVLRKDFREYAMGLTDTIRQATSQLAEKADRPVEYLASSGIRKEEYARKIAQPDNITSGLVCVLTAVEPCITFTVGPNREQKKLEVRRQEGKCLHQYFYLIDPQLGWLNVRLQTWFPFTVQIVINGREWLARQLIKQGIDFQRRDNCFVDIADVAIAQKLMDRQLRTNWAFLLNQLLRWVHPSHRNLFGSEQMHYYWSADETEWASDVMFRTPADLVGLYPRLVRDAMITFGCEDILRFLGKRPCTQWFKNAELVSQLGERCEGVRVKHALDCNSVKMDDKQGSVLRVETTVNNTRQMKIYRASEDNPAGPQSDQKLRKGVADLHRRAQISQKCNQRYLESLAAVEDETTLARAASSLCQRTTWHNRPVRALNPLAGEDAQLLAAVSCGEYSLQGFRNRDLCGLLFDDKHQLTERQQMTKVTRLIRLLRAHGLIQKVPQTHRYTLSPSGRCTITALLAARNANIRQLTDLGRASKQLEQFILQGGCCNSILRETCAV